MKEGHEEGSRRNEEEFGHDFHSEGVTSFPFVSHGLPLRHKQLGPYQ